MQIMQKGLVIIMTKQIMIVEDDRDLNAGLCKALKNENCIVTACHNLREAREQLALGTVSLVLLDIGLPDGNGTSFLREIKEHTPELPVILLTANDTDADIVEGLECGADDYITKPFSLAVLRARIDTQMRKACTAPSKNIYRTKRFSFDFSEMVFTADNQNIELSKTEQKLLRLLVENQGITLRRDGCQFVDENALSVTIKRLRDKLNIKNEIKTIYGIGYMWTNQNEEN